MSAREGKKAPPRAIAASPRGRLSGKAAFAAPVIVIGAALIANALLSRDADPALLWLRLGLPLAIAVIGAILLVDSIVNRGTPLASRPFLRGPVAGALISATTVAMAVADALSGEPPWWSAVGMMTLALLFWSRLALLGAFLCAIVASSVAATALSGHSRRAADYLFPVAAAGLAVVVTDAIRKSVKPSEERMAFLEHENKELWNLSYRDTLTGLYNRRYAQQMATQIVSRAQRYREPLHVFMIDIDHFKTVNDELGHPVGDIVLKRIAAAIQGFVRTSDTAARYGGEEFLVYLVQSSPEFAQYVANRIRDGVAALRMEEVPWQVTVSVGVAELQPDDTVESVVNRADQFLYQSKQNGRNRVSGA